MEADFSKQISEFLSSRHKTVVNYADLYDKLNNIIEKISEDLPLIHAQTAYRRGSASFDHIHFPGASRMQLGIARVLQLMSGAKVDNDLRNGNPAFYNETGLDAFIDYDGVILALAKVKLSEAGIDEIHRDLHFALDDKEWEILYRPFKTAEGFAVYTKDSKGHTIKLEFDPNASYAGVTNNEAWSPSFWCCKVLSCPVETEEFIEKIRNKEGPE